MKRFFIAAVAACSLALAGTAAAALVPGVFDPGNTGCPVATYSNGVLHLEKNCPTPTNAAAGADITGLEGQAFVSASFTLASATECQGGSPRFDVVTTTGLFFLGCNNVTPTTNANGSVTYTFTAASIAAGGLLFPTGTIQAMDILIDVQGSANITNITVNGQVQVPTTQAGKDQCKNGGWKNSTSPAFKNQGDCVSYFATGGRNPGNG